MEKKVLISEKEYDELVNRAKEAEETVKEYEQNIKDGVLAIKYAVDINFRDHYAEVGVNCIGPIEYRELRSQLADFASEIYKAVDKALDKIYDIDRDLSVKETPEGKAPQDKSYSEIKRSNEKMFTKKVLSFLGFDN